MIDPSPALAYLWQLAGAAPAALARLRFTACEDQLPSSYPVGKLAAATIGAQALAASEMWSQRVGREQEVGINLRHALASFSGEQYLRVNGGPPPQTFDPLFGFFRCADDRWIQLHTNFPHHRDGVLRVLGCTNDRDAVAKAIQTWSATELDTQLADDGLCASLIRTAQEWQALPAAAAVAGLPLFEIVRIGDAPPQPFPNAARRPLDGIRVLDLSRVIAAPVAARTLAQHGAEVLAISAAHLPNIVPLLMETGRGKRSAQLNLHSAPDLAKLQTLIADADVFLQAYRPGALDAFGLSAAQLAASHPGIVYVTLSAYGHEGQWSGRRGFDSLVQSATGIADGEARANAQSTPDKLPCQALDHGTGNIAAFATMIALQRRARDGGSWMVRVSLAQTGHWLQSMDKGEGRSGRKFTDSELKPWMKTESSAYGTIGYVAPVESMSETPPRFDLPASPPGTHPPCWKQ